MFLVLMLNTPVDSPGRQPSSDSLSLQSKSVALLALKHTFFFFCLKLDLSEFSTVCNNACVSVYCAHVCVLLVDLST